jgi:hypothetical protein
MTDQIPTPRTDEASWQSAFGEVVDSDFARQLERENIQMRDYIERLAAGHECGVNSHRRLLAFVDDMRRAYEEGK